MIEMKEARLRALTPTSGTATTTFILYRNERSPFKGIDTKNYNLCHTAYLLIEMKEARLRALTHSTSKAFTP